MKILIVCSGNSGKISPFIQEQVESLQKLGVEIQYFLIYGKGILGYLSNFSLLLKKIRNYKPDIIHAHYGLSGLLAVIQRRIPVIITFHGSDVNMSKERKFSFIASKLSKANIFVSKKMIDCQPTKKSYLIPCGVDLDIFKPLNKVSLRKKWEYDSLKKHVLFSSRFDNRVKNYALAKEAILKLDNVKIQELKGYNRFEVVELINLSDVCLLTSDSEGSPQFIKEAMACNVPIVSTDVGDVREVIGNTEGCYITSFEPEDVVDKIKKALAFGKRTTGREDIRHLESSVVAKKIINVYKKVLESK